MKKSIAFALAVLALSAQASIQLTWTSKDFHHPIDATEVETVDDVMLLHAWRGETVSAEALLRGDGETVTLSLPGAVASPMNYVLTDDQRSCGAHNFNLTPWLVADIIDNQSTVTLEAGTVRPVWCRIDIPADATPGVHDYTLTAGDQSLTLRVEVDEQILPPPAEWQFHLDLWQQPYSVSRYYGLERWSDAHFEALKPYMQQLARAGQKVVTAILFYEPWGDQSHDKFDPMVETVKTSTGAWAFSYDIFDRYVNLMDQCGINAQINCYSMVPWDMSFRYFDEATQSYKSLTTQTSTAAYRELWTAFITDFAAHLRQKGWFDKTCLAMDERSIGAMTDAWNLVQSVEPDFKMALAGNYHQTLATKLYDYCLQLGDKFPDADLAVRRDNGMITTVYTSCANNEPNIFSNNNPADAAWLPLYAVASGLDGYLHWSWLNWPDNPLGDSRFRLYSAGDTYMFYPGPRSSIRFERMIEGIQMAEKIRLLREQGADMRAIDAALAVIAQGKVSVISSADQIAALQHAIDNYSNVEQELLIALIQEARNAVSAYIKDEVGYYRSTTLDQELLAKADELEESLDVSQYDQLQRLLEAFRAGYDAEGIIQPKATEYYYLQTPLRGNYYTTATTTSVLGKTAPTTASAWAFQPRTDGTYNIVNYKNGRYVAPTAAYNSQLKMTTTEPAAGWDVKAADEPGYVILVSGTVQFNQTNISAQVYNWGGGAETADLGCKYRVILTDLGESSLPEVPVAPATSIVYDLHGRRIAQPVAPGIYIRNGQKFRK